MYGGKKIAISEFEDANEVAAGVKKINLTEKGIAAPTLCVTGHSTLEASLPGTGTTASVYANGERMTIARYPNDGYMTVGDITQGGYGDETSNMIFTVNDERASSWENAEDAWVFGYWYYDWSDQTAPVKSVSNGTIETTIRSAYGVQSGQRFYIYNLLEELDVEGEWFYDKETGDFYFYPPANCTEVTLAFDDNELINLNDADNVSILGLNIENTAKNAIKALYSDGLDVVGCNIKNTGNSGISASNVTDANIVGNNINNTGAVGIDVTGGDINTLESSGNVISGNTVYNVSQVITRYTPNIRIYGVGIEVSDNILYNAPHSGLMFNGNDHEISGNEIYNVLWDSADSGVIYAGREQIARGTKISNNYIHDISTTSSQNLVYAIYLDDCFSGTRIVDNRIENVRGTGVFINGGRDNTVTGNKFRGITSNGVELSNIGMTTWRGTDEEFKADMGIDSDLHTSAPYAKYEHLANILNDDYRKPKYNVINNNTYTECGNDIKIIVFENTNITEEQIRAINTIE